VLTAADILQPIDQGSHVFDVMGGHLQSACFAHEQPARMVRKGYSGCHLVLDVMLATGDDAAAMHLV
jgi:hypothetical protein